MVAVKLAVNTVQICHCHSFREEIENEQFMQKLSYILFCSGRWTFPKSSRQPRRLQKKMFLLLGLTEPPVTPPSRLHPPPTSPAGETPSLWCSEDRSVSRRAGGKAGMLNFAWILFEVSGDKTGSSPVFSHVHCAEQEEARYDRAIVWGEYKALKRKIPFSSLFLESFQIVITAKNRQMRQIWIPFASVPQMTKRSKHWNHRSFKQLHYTVYTREYFDHIIFVHIFQLQAV